MKTIERKEIAERFLYGFRGFYKTAPRLGNGAVDWSKVDDDTQKMVQISNRKIALFHKIDDELIREVSRKFYASQFTYSQSF